MALAMRHGRRSDPDPARAAEATRGERLPSRLRRVLRTRHYSVHTEAANVGWVHRFVRFHGLVHPSAMGEREVEAFLSHLAVEGRVAPSTHDQALAALLFLSRDVLGLPLCVPEQAVRARGRPRLPVVPSRSEVRAVLARLHGTPAPVGLLLYGGWLRLAECLTLRVNDVDVEGGEILVRAGEGGRDRRTVLPDAAPPARDGEAVRDDGGSAR